MYPSLLPCFLPSWAAILKLSFPPNCHCEPAAVRLGCIALRHGAAIPGQHRGLAETDEVREHRDCFGAATLDAFAAALAMTDCTDWSS